MAIFCFNKNHSLYKLIIEYGLLSDNDLHRCMQRINGHSITNSLYFKEALIHTHNDYFEALKITLQAILETPRKNNEDWYITYFESYNPQTSNDEDVEANTAVEQLKTQMGDVTNFYQRHPQYQQYVSHANAILQAIRDGSMTDNTVKELCNELSKHISMYVNMLFKKVTRANVRGTSPTETLLLDIVRQCGQDNSRKTFYQKVHQSKDVSFSDIVNNALDLMQANMANNDNLTQQEINNFEFLRTHLDAFLIMITPQLKRTEGIALRLNKVPNFVLNDLATEILSELSDDIEIVDDDLNSEDEHDNVAIDVNSNDTTTSRSQLEDALTVNMEESLSNRLIRLISYIPIVPTDQNAKTRFGSVNFYNGRRIYKDLVEKCYLCTDSQDLMKFLISDEFEAPYKTGLLNVLNPNVARLTPEQIDDLRRLQTELFTAIHTARHKFISTVAIQEGNDAVTTFSTDSSIVNQIQDRSTLQQLFYTTAITGSPFLSLTPDRQHYTVTETNKQHIQITKQILRTLSTKFQNGNNFPRIELNKTKTRSGMKRGYFKDGNRQIFGVNELLQFTRHTSIFSTFTKPQQQFITDNLNLNEKDCTFDNLLQQIINKTGLNHTLINPDEATHLLFYRFTAAQGGKATFRAERFINHLDNLITFLTNIEDGKSEAHTRSFKLFKKLNAAMGTKAGEQLTDIVYHHKKSYNTTTQLNYIQDLFNSFKYNTRAQWFSLRESLSSPQRDEFAAFFTDQTWFHSILFDVCNKVCDHILKDAADDERLTDQDLQQIPQLCTFLDFNEQPWGDIDNIDYTLTSIQNFFNLNKQNNHQKGIPDNASFQLNDVSKRRLYLMPTFEAKGQAYYLEYFSYDSNIIEELIAKGHKQSTIAQYRASMAMQEIHRILRSYEREIQRQEVHDTYQNKNDGVDNCTLVPILDENGIEIATQQLINFEQVNQSAIDEHDLGGARFYFLNTFNKYLPYINDLNNTKTQNELKPSEQKLVNWMRRYIYGNHIENVEPVPQDELTAMWYDVADVVEEHLDREFNQFLDDNEVLADNRLLIERLSGIDKTDEYKKVFNQLQNEKKAQTQQQRNDIITNPNLTEQERQDALSQLESENAMQELDTDDVIKKLLRYYFYNHLLMNEQVFHLLFNDLMRLKNSNNVQKRAGMAVSTGMSCDEGAQIATSNISTCMLKDFNGTVMQPLLHENELNYMCDIYQQTHLQHLQKVFPDQNSIGYKTAFDNLQNAVKSFRNSWQKIDGTDGQSIMSIPMMKKHWNMLGRATKEMNQAFDMLTEIYSMNPDDDALETKLQEYYQFVKQSFNSWDIETQKTFTAGTVEMSDVVRTGLETTQEILWKQPMSIKTADYICLDPRAIMDPNNSTKLTFLWGLNKFLIEQGIDRACYGTAVKHNQVKLLEVPQKTTETTSDEHLKTLFTNWKNTVLENNKQYVLNYPARWMKHQLETHAHFLDSKSILGVQFQKMITESVNIDSNYRLGDDKTINGQDVLTLIDQLYELKTNQIVQNIREQINTDTTELSQKQINQERNYKLSQLLTKQLENSNEFSFNAWWGLQLNEEGNFNIPLDTPSNLQFITKLIFSLVKNNIIKQKITGGQLVQVADIHGALKRIQQNLFTKDDISDDESLNLEFEYENNDPNGKIIGIKSLEVELPLYAKPLIEKYLAEDGTVDTKSLLEEQPQLGKLIGYRIPTEGYCSMFTMKVKRFLNPMGGGNVKFPAAITKITGSDFDIDKIFFVAPTLDTNGKYIDPIQLLTALYNNKSDINIEDGVVDNALLYLWGQILEHHDTLVERITPGGFDTFVYFGDVISNMNFYMREQHLNASEAYLKATQDRSNNIRRNFLYGRSIGNPDVQKAFHTRNNIGKKSVGIFANPRQVHAFLTRYEVPLKVNTSTHHKSGDIQQLILDGRVIVSADSQKDLTYVTETGNRCLRYDQIYCYDELVKISDILRELLSASVDAVKQPILDGLNINDATINIIIPLIRLGFNFEQIVLLLQQPIVKQWCKIYKRKQVELASRGETYLDATGLMAECYKNVQSPINLDLSVYDVDDHTKPGSLILGLSQNANDIEQQALIPLLYKALSISEDLRFLNGKVKIDSSSENTWSDFFGYVKFLTDQRLFENRIQNQQGEFDPVVFNIFDGTIKGHSRKLVSCFQGVTSLIEDIIEQAMPNLNIDRFVDMIVTLNRYAGGRIISQKQIRNMFYSYQAFMYQKYKKDNKIASKGVNYWIEQFPAIFAQAGSTATNLHKYDKLLSPIYGLHLKQPTVKPTNKFKSLTKIMTIGCFMKDVSEETRNDMKNQWAAMLYDHTPIPDTKLTWSEFGQQLIDYVIQKNGFSVTNNSFAQLIPYNALEYLPALRNYTTKCQMNNENVEQFLELFARHENIAYMSKGVAGIQNDFYKKSDIIFISDLISKEDSEKLIELPKFINCNYQFFIRMGETDNYKHVCTLGAPEIAVEYDYSFAGSRFGTATAFQVKNQNWEDKLNTNVKDLSGKTIAQKTPQEALFTQMQERYETGMSYIKQKANTAQEEVLNYLMKNRSKDFSMIDFQYFQTGIPQMDNKEPQEIKDIYNRILKEMNKIIKDKNYCLQLF